MSSILYEVDKLGLFYHVLFSYPLKKKVNSGCYSVVQTYKSATM